MGVYHKSLYDYCIENESKRYLLDLWDSSENDKLGLTPKNVGYGSEKVVHWKCKLGHYWENQINFQNRGACPYCSNHRVWRGFNDLETLRPDLLKEWDFEKNDKLGVRPNNVLCGSYKEVWWKCKKGHSYLSQIYLRCKAKIGCPKCNNHSSIPEMVVFYILNNIFDNVQHRIKIEGVEFDIFVKDINLLIEYDGWAFHHNRREKDLEKEKMALNNGFKFLRIVEILGKNEIDRKFTNAIIYKVGNNYDYIALGELLLNYIRDKYKKGEKYIIPNDLEQKVLEFAKTVEYKNSLEYLRPEIAKEWHPIKNGSLRPSDFSYGSTHSIWWRCNTCGHEWKQTINNRTKDGRKKGYVGCPVCANKEVKKGVNDFKTFCLENNMQYLLDEWAYDLNDKKPEDFVKGSATKVKWYCQNGHPLYVYESPIRERVNGKGCAVCCNNKVLKGYNDFETIAPKEVLSLWDYSKNKKLPSEIFWNSTLEAFWKYGDSCWNDKISKVMYWVKNGKLDEYIYKKIK